MNGNALHILLTTTKAIEDAEKNEAAKQEQNDREVAEPFIEHYPCSCGHCPSCGLQFVPTDQEIRDWSVEDNIEHWSWEDRKKHYSGS